MGRRGAGQIIQRAERKFLIRAYAGRDAAGKRKWVSKVVRGTRTDAARALRALLVAKDQRRLALPESATLGTFLAKWLQDYAAGRVAPTTLADYEDTIRLHLAPALGHIRLQRLTLQHIQGYFSRKLQDGKLSTTTLHKHGALLKEALGRAVRWGLLGRNPCDVVDIPRRRRVEMKTWDQEQIRMFLAAAKRSSPQHYALYLAAATTGMRAGELAGLRWGDVNLTLGTATVQQTFYRLSGSKKAGRKAQALFKPPKTAKGQRTVELGPTLIEALRPLRAEQERRRTTTGDCPEGRGCHMPTCLAWHDFDLVFTQGNGKPLRMNNIVRRNFHPLIEKAKLPQITFHGLRHSHGTDMFAAGENPRLVSERLGHADPGFTLRVYGHVLPGMQAQAVARLEARLFGDADGRREEANEQATPQEHHKTL